MSYKFDKVWQYRSPIPVGRRGVISSFKLFLPAAVPMCRGRGRGSAPCDCVLLSQLLFPQFLRYVLVNMCFNIVKIKDTLT